MPRRCRTNIADSPSFESSGCDRRETGSTRAAEPEAGGANLSSQAGPAAWGPWLDRRDLLRIGSLSIAASALPTMLSSVAPTTAAEQRGRSKAQSVIFLWMAGGVTHIDSFDPKPNAPIEVRGTLETISTSLPGVQFCETIPELAKVADRLAVLRSFSHDSDDHLLSQVYTLSGRKVDRNRLFTEPNIGSMVSFLQGSRGSLPPYIAVPGITRPGPPPHNFFLPGWLGSHHSPYCLGGVPEQPDFTANPQLDDPPAQYEEDLVPKSLALDAALTRQRLDGRVQLRDQLDGALRTLENDQTLASVEAKYQKALRLLGTPAIRQAFELSEESAATRELYGRTKIGGRCLMARRLVEAGAQFVMVDYGYDPDYGNVWDNHNAPSQNHPPIQQMVKRGYHLAGMDRAFAALVGDLEQRGLLDSTLVVFITEFGRTPKINARGGRDHWGRCGSLFFAGGGTKAGQVIGESDATASRPITTPYSPSDVTATIYSALGIDHTGFVQDIFDRPRPILEDGRVIPEII